MWRHLLEHGPPSKDHTLETATIWLSFLQWSSPGGRPSVTTGALEVPCFTIWPHSSGTLDSREPTWIFRGLVSSSLLDRSAVATRSASFVSCLLQTPDDSGVWVNQLLSYFTGQWALPLVLLGCPDPVQNFSLRCVEGRLSRTLCTYHECLIPDSPLAQSWAFPPEACWPLTVLILSHWWCRLRCSLNFTGVWGVVSIFEVLAT